MIYLLLLLLYPAVALGAHDFDGTDDVGLNNAAVVAAHPYSFSCLFNEDDNTAGDSLLAITDGPNVVQIGDQIDASGTDTGDPLRARSLNVTAANALTTTGFTTGTWHVATAVFASDASRAAYIDGGSKASDTTSLDSDASVQTTTVGARRTNGANIGFLNGRLAECAVWNAALSDEEVATLGKKFAPSCVRRGALVGYWPMIRDTTTFKDYAGDAFDLTITGATVAAHPSVIRCDE